jgi:membrane protease YdiL (CAAX protease family)
MKTVIRSLLLGLGVTIATVLPWSLLASANLRISPQAPWAVPISVIYLGFLLAYLNGLGWPQTTSASRHCLLRLRWLTGTEWCWALTAGCLGVLALWLLYAALGGLSGAAPRRNSNLAIPVLVLAVFASAAVTAIGEEAGFRGYMQASLETRFGPAKTLLIVGLAFTLIHISHGIAALARNGVFYFAVSCIYGLLSYFTKSIVPSLFLHFVGDVALFALLSAVIHLELPRNPLLRASFCLLALLLALGCTAAFARLAHLRIARASAKQQ